MSGKQHNIPKVKFDHSRKKELDGFDFFALETLFIREESIDHDPFLPHRLDFFALLIIRSGTVNHTVDFKQIKLGAGDSLVIGKGQIHAFDPNQTYSGHLVIFSEGFLLRYMSTDTIAKVRHLFDFFIDSTLYHIPEADKEFISQLNTIANGSFGDARPNIIGAQLTTHLLKLRFSKTSSKKELPQPVINHFVRFKNEVEQHFSNTRDAKDYAVKLAISYKHLNEVCKAVTGKTAKTFIDEYVCLEAKRRLVITDLSSKEIAYDMGFEEPTNFVKFFKRNTGITPVEFRKKSSR